MENPGSIMFKNLRRCLIVAVVLLAMGCETRPTATSAAPPFFDNDAAEEIADGIAALYHGQDGENHCYMRLDRLAFEHFTLVRQELKQYPRGACQRNLA